MPETSFTICIVFPIKQLFTVEFQRYIRSFSNNNDFKNVLLTENISDFFSNLSKSKVK